MRNVLLRPLDLKQKLIISLKQDLSSQFYICKQHMLNYVTSRGLCRSLRFLETLQYCLALANTKTREISQK